jgi:hypothetical protein
MEWIALRQLFVVVLLLLSGCNAFTEMTAGPAETPMVTPAPVPSQTSTPTESSLAPGLTKYGLTNASVLLSAHAAVLRNTSFTVRKTVLLKYPNGTVAEQWVETIRVDGNTSYVVSVRTYSGSRETKRIETWHGPNRSIRKTVTNDSVSYSPSSHSGRVHQLWHPPDQRLSGAFDPQHDPLVERVHRNGTTLYHLENEYQYSNITISMYIEPHGVIRRYSVQKQPSDPSIPGVTLITGSIRTTNIGTTTVDRPAWYAEAINKTTPVTNDKTHT